MKIIATFPVRNESWIVGLSARVALRWVDELIVLNHASTDGTIDILAQLKTEFPSRVHIISVPDQEWREMEHRQLMLDLARHHGASHIAIIDADEILCGVSLPHIRGWCANLTHGMILQLPLYNLRNTPDQYHANGVWGKRITSVAFLDELTLNWKGDRFHHREPMGRPLSGYPPIRQGEGGVMHLWGLTERRLLAKHALYKCTERLRWPEKDTLGIDQEYSQCKYGRPWAGDYAAAWTFKPVPESWWSTYADLMKYLDLTSEPWQEKRVHELIQVYGAQRFAGLDLFGLQEAA